MCPSDFLHNNNIWDDKATIYRMINQQKSQIRPWKPYGLPAGCSLTLELYFKNQYLFPSSYTAWRPRHLSSLFLSRRGHSARTSPYNTNLAWRHLWLRSRPSRRKQSKGVYEAHPGRAARCWVLLGAGASRCGWLLKAARKGFSYVHILKDAKNHKDYVSKGIKILGRCFTARWPHRLVGTNPCLVTPIVQGVLSSSCFCFSKVPQ